MNRLFNTISSNTRKALWFFALVTIVVLKNRQANAQVSDSVHLLQSVTIESDRLTIYTHGLKIISFDSTTLDNFRSDNAATLLASQTAVYVKTYGQGGLATLSIRGTLATHAGVYWNGVNINQPNIGMTDISLVPLFFFETVALQYGGSSAIFGSGNVGGGLHLENCAHFSSPLKLKILSGIGSSQEYTGNIKASCGGRNIAWEGGVSFNSQKNNFPYINSYNQHVHQQNASLRNNNIFQQIDIKTSRNSTLSAGLWWLNSDRDLPSSMISSPGKEHQKDQSTRTYIKWELLHPGNILIIRSSLLVENMQYLNPQLLIDAHYRTLSGIVEGEYQWQAGAKTLIGFAGSASRDNASIYAYSGDKIQSAESVVGSVQQVLPLPGWVATFSVRKEWCQGFKVPFYPSFGAEGRLSKNFSAKLHFSYNFRVPTLNDRFWQPGGNENLKPETSRSGEAGINWQTSNAIRNWQAGLGITVYNSLIKDLILWTPASGIYWSPENIQEVVSQGLEFTSKFGVKFRKFEGKIHAAYSYTSSNFNKNEAGMEPVKGNQMTYIPLHTAIAGFRIDRGIFFIDWEQSLTGKRFILKDNSTFLEGYTLGSFAAGSSLTFKKTTINLQAEIRNLFDTRYQAIQYYAVPGRSFRLIINFIL